jgi:hypothetical protein
LSLLLWEHEMYPPDAWHALVARLNREINIGLAPGNKADRTLLIPTPAARQRFQRILFLRYLFCKFDPTIHARIVTTPGLASVLSFWGTAVAGRIPELRVFVQSSIPIAESKTLGVRRRTSVNSPAG